MRCSQLLAFVLALGSMASAALAEDAITFSFRSQEIETGLEVGYAVALLDMNADEQLDILVVDSKRLVWYENPSWKPHSFLDGQTKADNVCIAPHDIDGDGLVDFALGADWRPRDTADSGSIEWLTRGGSPGGEWQLRLIAQEPTTHRMRWANVDDDESLELVVLPLFGRSTTPPKYAEQGVRLLAFDVPADPTERWPMTVLDDSLHVCHNFVPTNFDDDPETELLIVSFEGVSLLDRQNGAWQRRLIGSGNQQTSPNTGASEIKHGRLAGGADYIATIEPWHGSQVVVYTRPESGAGDAALWTRHVLDDDLQWGHALWCANLDGDAAEELIVGVRDDRENAGRRGVRIYDPNDNPAAQWSRQLLEPGAVAVEDLAAADLNGDGRIDLVAAGRQTHNVRIYWNETEQK